MIGSLGVTWEAVGGCASPLVAPLSLYSLSLDWGQLSCSLCTLIFSWHHSASYCRTRGWGLGPHLGNELLPPNPVTTPTPPVSVAASEVMGASHRLGPLPFPLREPKQNPIFTCGTLPSPDPSSLHLSPGFLRLQLKRVSPPLTLPLGSLLPSLLLGMVGT